MKVRIISALLAFVMLIALLPVAASAMQISVKLTVADGAGQTVTLDGAGSCVQIDASESKGGGFMPDRLQTVYVIPAADGCRVATEHYEIVESEGFGRRFSSMMRTLSVLPKASVAVIADGQPGPAITDEQAVAAIRAYCLAADPTLEGIVNAGEYPVFWE